MKSTFIFWRTTMAVLLCTQGLASAAGDGGVITVQANGFADSQGHAIAKLFQPGDNVLEKGRWEAVGTIKDGHATMVFPPLLAGIYALVVFHDHNDNGHIDHGWMGPAEPLGFSGGFKLTLFSGRPTFNELKFSFEGMPKTMSVTVAPF